jgi:hypothetical protein
VSKPAGHRTLLMETLASPRCTAWPNRNGDGERTENSISGVLGSATSPRIYPVYLHPSSSRSPGGTWTKETLKGVPIKLGPSLLPHEQIITPIPESAPTRFGNARGIHHEYTYAGPNGSTIFIHVHRNSSGYANKAHSKDSRYLFIVGREGRTIFRLTSLRHMASQIAIPARSFFRIIQRTCEGSQLNSGCGKGWVSEAAGGGERGVTVRQHCL